MNKKKFFIVILFISVIVCVRISLNKKNTDSLTLSIYPSSTIYESYSFSLNSDSILCASFGTRELGKNFESASLTNIIESNEIVLSESQTNRIIELADEVKKNNENIEYYSISDSWIVILRYKNKNYSSNLWDVNKKYLNELAEQIIKHSPIDVDIHGWS